MNMKRLLTLVAFFATVHASAQQVNPVPDYVFANRMSAGRNTVTDTAAYFSIGPRYGATRGMMPPMVVDTASFSANKRNGLLIFSVQKNKFLYWDSVGVKWAEMAGTGGSAITGSGVAGYMPEFTTTTNLDTTRLYHSAGRFAIGSTTTSNGVFNVYGGTTYLDTNFVISNNVLFVNESSGNIGINTSTPEAFTNTRTLQINGAVDSVGGVFQTRTIDGSRNARFFTYPEGAGINVSTNHPFVFLTNNSERMRISSTGKVLINRKVADTFNLDVTGNFRVTHTLPNVAEFYGTDANVGVNIKNNQTLSSTTSAQLRLVNGTTDFGANDRSWQIINDGTSSSAADLAFQYWNGSLYAESYRATASGELLINTTSDAGNYKLQVSGTMYSTSGAVFAPTSGDVKIGTTTNSATATVKLSIVGSSTSDAYIQVLNGGGGGFALGSNVGPGFQIYNTTGTQGSESYAKKLEVNSAGELLVNGISDAGAYALQVSGNIYGTGSVTTGAPSGGSIKPWKIGEAATISPTSPNRTLRVEVDGVVYYIHAKTTND